jgi:hypothetical protein
MTTDATRNSWDDMLAKLKQERDELALKMHLGKKEVAAEWEKLEAKWNEIRTTKVPPIRDAARETAEGLGSALDLAAAELKKGYAKIRELL